MQLVSHGGKTIHAFTGSGDFVIDYSTMVHLQKCLIMLLGRWWRWQRQPRSNWGGAGGGGAGAYVYQDPDTPFAASTTYTIAVGGGGAAGSME